MLLVDKLQDASKGKNIDEEWIVDRLYKEAVNSKSRGMERLEAIKILARINGVETERHDPKFVSANVNFNQFTIQDQRRNAVPTLGVLKATIELLKQRDMLPQPDDGEITEADFTEVDDESEPEAESGREAVSA
jgi:hypothetical protein